MRYQARRVPDRGWCVVDLDGSKVLPTSPGHYWEGRRPADLAASVLNDRNGPLRPLPVPAGSCVVLDDWKRNHELQTNVLGFIVAGACKITELARRTGNTGYGSTHRVREAVHALKDRGLVIWDQRTKGWAATERGVIAHGRKRKVKA